MFQLSPLQRPLLSGKRHAAYRPPVIEDLGRPAVTLPRRLDRVSAQAERGHLAINLRISEAERCLSDLNRMVNRLILAMLAIGFIVALAVLMAAFHPPGLESFGGWIFGFGFLAVAVIGVWVMLEVLAPRRH